MAWFFSRKERPDARDVAIRAIVLRHVISYALITPTPETLKNAALWWTDEEKRHFARDSKQTRDGFWSSLGSYKKYLSPTETSFSRATRETMTGEQLINASWRVESLMAILWALQVIEGIPPYDEQTSPDLFGDFPLVNADEFVSSALLRPAEEISAARDVAEAWHWRSRTRQIIESGEPFPSDPQLHAAGFTSYDSIVRSSAMMHEGDGTFSQAIDEDYPAFGKAYRDLTDDEWSVTRSITMERHHALNWLCGYAPRHRWDDTPTDT